jgi:hypothetical protein
MHSDWFNGIKTLQSRWQHGEKVGYCYPSGLEKTLCKWDTHVPLVTKGVNPFKLARIHSDWFNGMKTWDTAIPADLKRLLVKWDIHTCPAGHEGDNPFKHARIPAFVNA